MTHLEARQIIVKDKRDELALPVSTVKNLSLFLTIEKGQEGRVIRFECE